MLGATVRLQYGAEESHLTGCYGTVESIDSARALNVRLEPPDGEAAGRLLVLSLGSVEQVCSGCKGCSSLLRVCTQCRKAWYCSKTCQKVHFYAA